MMSAMSLAFSSNQPSASLFFTMKHLILFVTNFVSITIAQKRV